MARLELDAGPFPANARSVVWDYRQDGDTAYVRLGETRDQVSRWDVPIVPPVYVRARFRSLRGRLGSGTESPRFGETAVQDRPAPSSLTAPAAKVVQDGPVLNVSQDAPDGEDAKEYAVEVVQTPSADTDPSDGLHGGYHAVGEGIPLHAWDVAQKVWTRLVRHEDGERTAWASETVQPVTPAVTAAVGHTNEFASGTIGTLGGSESPLEISGGDLQHAALYAGDAAGFAGDADYFAGDAGLYWSPAVYTTPNITLDVQEPLVFQVQPVLTSLTRPTLYAGDALIFAGGAPRIDIDGSVNDPRLRSLNLTAGGGDEVPMEVDVEVATSASASPTFTDSDFVPLHPGRVFPAVRTYAVRFTIRTWLGARFVIDTLKVWHHVWCKLRPWHTHSHAYELIAEETLASASDQFADVAIIGQDYDELLILVDWTTTATAITLQCYFNADIANVVTLSQLALASGDRETLELRVKPKTGDNRVVEILRDLQYDGTNWARRAPAIDEWVNTATAITSLRFISSNTPTNGIDAGSILRVFGKRYHQE